MKTYREFLAEDITSFNYLLNSKSHLLKTGKNTYGEFADSLGKVHPDSDVLAAHFIQKLRQTPHYEIHKDVSGKLTVPNFSEFDKH